MAEDIIAHNLYGIAIGQRISDGYINATKLAKAYTENTGIVKRVQHWLDTDRAKSYIEMLSAKTGIPALELVQVKKGGNNAGTWIHPKLGTPFGTWLSVEFEFQVSEWVEQWMTTGRNPIDRPTRNEQYFLSLVEEKPRKWEEFFDADFRTEACRLTGYRWDWHVMSKFLNRVVYDYFPEPMREKLDEVNPIDSAGRRRRKQHQHLAPEAQGKLKTHIKTVTALMQVAVGIQEFQNFMAIKFHNADRQITLWNLDSIDDKA